MTPPTRRERPRTATVAEIKRGARRLLVAGGPEAISLRAIARTMGLSAPALYHYFPSLEALVVALAGDLYDELRVAVAAARDRAGDDPVNQLLAMATAFRHWSVGHPAEFTLVFGSPVPGMSAFAEGCVDQDNPAARFGAVFLESFIALAGRAPLNVPPRSVLERHLGDRLAPLWRSHGELPIEVAYAYLSGWTRLYGLVAMEVFDHLSWAVTDAAGLFETELSGFLGQLASSPSPGAGRH